MSGPLDLFGEASVAWNPIRTAARYAGSGLRVVSLIGKRPWRTDWPDLSTTNVTDLTDEFMDACRRAGSVDRVWVGWALGMPHGPELTQYMGLDIDHPECIGPELQAVLDHGGYAMNPTSSPGRFHAIWKMPAGITVSNSATKFPEQGWGEVRGFHGQLCIAGPDRLGFDVGELAGVTPFPRPEWLCDFEDSATAATSDEVRAFLSKYTSTLAMPRRLDTIVGKADDRLWRASRHERARDALAWAMRDARAGFLPAAAAVSALRSRFLAAVAGDTERARLYPNPEFEVEKLIARAIGLANEMTDQEVFDRYHDAIAAGTFELPMNGAGTQMVVTDDCQASARPSRALRLPSVTSVEVRRVRWLWDARAPLGALTLLGGREGIGKSILAVEVAAKITRGKLEGEFFGQPRPVVIAATEDSWAHTIKPRLIVAGADCDLVLRVDVTESDGKPGRLILPHDIDALAEAVAYVGAALVVLDPIISRLDAAIDSHRDAEVRRGLEPLADAADRGDFSILGLIHVNKGTSGDPLTMIMASRAFVAVARAVMFTTLDPEQPGMRLLGQPKNNLGRTDLDTLLFDIVEKSAGIDKTDGSRVMAGALRWCGVSQRTIVEAIHEAGRSPDARQAGKEAEDWLRDYLKANPVADSKDVKTAAAAEGHSERTLKRARSNIGSGVSHVGMPGRTVWSAPGLTPDEVEKVVASWAKVLDGPVGPSVPTAQRLV